MRRGAGSPWYDVITTPDDTIIFIPVNSDSVEDQQRAQFIVDACNHWEEVAALKNERTTRLQTREVATPIS